MPDEIVEVTQEDLLYLVKLADWCAGQGFCGIDDLKDPDEWCYDKWRALGPEDSSGYSVEALAGALAATADLKASNAALVQRVARGINHEKIHKEARRRALNDATGQSYDYHSFIVAAEHGARAALQAYADGEKVA